MGYQIEYLSEDDIVQVSVSGEFNFEGILNIATETVRELSKYGSHRVLQDQRDAKLELSTLEIFKLPRVARALGLANNTKIALVYRENLVDYQFVETTTVNQGYVLKIFSDLKAAKKWLIETPTGPTKLS